MARTKRKNLAAIAALRDGDDNEEDVAAESDDQEKEISPHCAPEDEDSQGDHLEVEFVEQRIVFLIPPLPSKPKIARRTTKQKPAQQPQQIEESRFALKKCLATEMSIAAMISPPAAPSPISRNEAQLAIAMRHRDIGRLNFVRKRLQRSGGLSLWLRSKGLGRFVRIFQDQRIDEVKLVDLTMDALKQIGVLPVGPRRKLIAAIQQLCIS